ncbi:MAG TPA: PP2C family protein-serine/threonine phosphatase [Xanthobacteraceae bacterium]|nr:PP2C family protein-serine/threonine phosphatase [Xanthobacteraceae bacterium]
MEGLPASVAERLRELTYSERAVAYLQVDGGLALIGAGGHLDNYGLEAVRLGEPAVEQAFFLEGLLPLAETPYFVPSVELDGGRAADLHFHLDADIVWVVLLDVTANRDAARRLQQKAYEMTLLQEQEALLNRRLEAANAALHVAQRELEISRDAAREELRRKQVELAEARTLQLALAPPPYQGVVGGRALTVDLVLEPAKEVGGDMVDHFCIGDDLLVLVLGDVSDKGAGAALMMARTHALFRGIAARPDAARLFRAPQDAVRLVNTTLAEGNSSCMFVTLLIAAFEGTTGKLTYVRAGHVPPFLRRAGGTVERLDAPGGLPLGLMEDAVHKSAVVAFGPGDELLIVTDGITEAMDPAHELFGEARVADLVAQRGLRAQALLLQLLARVRAFEAGSPQSDDIAAILLRLGAG